MEETPSTEKSEPERFEDGFHYLTSWFRLLGPAHVEDESRARLDEISPFEERLDCMKVLERTTENTLEAGIPLPFEEFVGAGELDLVDRLILLSLLRNGLDPQSQGGLRLVRVMHALGANHVGRQWEVRSRLETGGALRDLGLIECAPSSNPTQRLYRLPRRMIEPLTTGEGDGLGLPDLPANRQEALDDLEYDTRQLMDAIRLPAHETENMWQGVREGKPGWDWTVLRRGRLAARLQAAYRTKNDAIGAELRRLALTPEEQLVWAILFLDSSEGQVGLAVPYVLKFTGSHDDAEPAATRLLGPNSKLATAGVLRFNRTDAPLLTRIVGISQEARSRVALWPKNAFALKPGFSLDLTCEEQRTLGFGGTRRIQDRASATGGSR